jgi:hypothetical protein
MSASSINLVEKIGGGGGPGSQKIAGGERSRSVYLLIHGQSDFTVVEKQPITTETIWSCNSARAPPSSNKICEECSHD